MRACAHPTMDETGTGGPVLPKSVVQNVAQWCSLTDLLTLRRVCRTWAECIAQHGVTALRAPPPPTPATNDLAHMVAAFPAATSLCVSPGALQGTPSSVLSHITRLVVESGLKSSQPVLGQVLLSARALVGMAQLQHMGVRECMLLTEGLDGLLALRRLVTLDLSGCFEVNNKLVALLPKLPALKELHLPAPASHAPRLNQCTPQGLHMLLPALPALTSLHLTTPNLELHGREAVRHASPSPASHPTIIKALGSRSRLMALSLHALAEPDAKAAAACGSGRDSLSGRPSACGSGMPDILVSAHGVVVQLPAAGPVVAALGSFTALTQLTYLSLSPHVFHSYSDGGLSHAASQLSLAQFTDACMGDVAPPYSPATSAHLVTPATFLMSGAGAMPPLNAFAPPSPTLHATSPTKHVTSPTLHGTSSNSSSLLGGIPALGAMAVGGAASQAVYRISSGSLGLFDRMGTGLSITSREATPPTSPLPHPISRTGTGTLSHAGSVLLPTAARLGLLVTDGLVAELCGSLKHLVALELMDCWELGAAGLAAIASNLPALTELDLTGSCRMLPPTELTQLAPLSALRWLSLSRWGARAWRPPHMWRAEVAQYEERSLLVEGLESEEEEEDQGQEEVDGEGDQGNGGHNSGTCVPDSAPLSLLDEEVVTRLACKLGINLGLDEATDGGRVSGSGANGGLTLSGENISSSGQHAQNRSQYETANISNYQDLLVTSDFDAAAFQGFDSQGGGQRVAPPATGTAAGQPPRMTLERLLLGRASARRSSVDLQAAWFPVIGSMCASTAASVTDSGGALALLGSSQSGVGSGDGGGMNSEFSLVASMSGVTPGRQPSPIRAIDISSNTQAEAGGDVRLSEAPNTDTAPLTPTLAHMRSRAAGAAAREAVLGSALAALGRDSSSGPAATAKQLLHHVFASGSRAPCASPSQATGGMAAAGSCMAGAQEASRSVPLASVMQANLSITSLVASDAASGSPSPIVCHASHVGPNRSRVSFERAKQHACTRATDVGGTGVDHAASPRLGEGSNAAALASTSCLMAGRDSVVSGSTAAAAAPHAVMAALRHALARQRRRQQSSGLWGSRHDLTALARASSFEELEATDPLAAAMARLSAQHPCLTELHLGGWEQMSPDAVHCLAAGPAGRSSLRVLRLTGCQWLRTPHVAALAGAEHLRELDISYTVLRPRVLEALGALPNLEVVDMEGCLASWEATRAVRSLTELRGVRVRHFVHPDMAPGAMQGTRLAGDSWARPQSSRPAAAMVPSAYSP